MQSYLSFSLPLFLSASVACNFPPLPMATYNFCRRRRRTQMETRPTRQKMPKPQTRYAQNEHTTPAYLATTSWPPVAHVHRLEHTHAAYSKTPSRRYNSTRPCTGIPSNVTFVSAEGSFHCISENWVFF